MTDITEKKEHLLKALERGIVMIHLDARREGVVVPEHLRGEANLCLNLSYRFAPGDLVVSTEGVRSTLSFSGQYASVVVPWAAVFAISNPAARVPVAMFPEDMPPEVLKRVLGATPTSEAPAAPNPRKRHLRLLN
jgi:stringent starvation protein B